MNTCSKKYELVEMRCENCGAKLRFDASKNVAVCEFCNTDYVIKTINDENTFNNHGSANDRGHVKEKKQENKGKRKVNKNSEAFKLGYELGKSYGDTIGKNRGL